MSATNRGYNRANARAVWLLVAVAVVLVARPGLAQVMVDPNLTMVARNPSGVSVELPLVEESLKVSIDHQHATTELRQTYKNPHADVLEGLFSFRGGEGAHVSGFAYWNGDQKIVGEVLERRVAQDLYYSTTQRRRDPGLLEKTGEGSFAFRVYPIQPNENKRVELKIEQWLRRNDRTVEYRIPVSKIGAEIDIDIRDERSIKALRSSSHRIETLGGAKHAHVRVGSPLGSSRDRVSELVIRYELGDAPYALSAVVHRDPGEDAFVAVTLAAPHVTTSVRQDVTLIVDPVMTAPDLALATLAAQRIVDQLDAGDRVNLVVAGSSDPLFDKPRWATKRVRADVAAALATVRARRGAHQLESALWLGLSMRPVGGRIRTVTVLSNGQPTANPLFDWLDERLKASRGQRSDLRIVTIGVGANADSAMLGRLAAMGHGELVIVPDKASLAGIVDRLGKQVAGRILDDVRLEARGGHLHEVYPGETALYQGRDLLFVARLRGEDRAELVLRGKAGKPIELIKTVRIPSSARRPWVGMLWGRERVKHLLRDIAQRGENGALVKEVTELGLSYNIVTPYTAFLAIPESELSVHDGMTLADARAKKRELMERRSDVASLMAPAMVEDGVAAAPPSYAGADETMAPSAADMAEVHGSGCAGCHVGSRGTMERVWLLSSLAFAWSVARVRRRRTMRSQPMTTRSRPPSFAA